MSGMGRDRRMLVVMVTVTALVTIGLAVLAIVALGGGGPRGQSEPAPPASVTLEVGPAQQARCAAPTVQALQQQDTAFEGVVVDANSSRVQLKVSRWFAGGSAREVVVKAPDPALQKVLISIDFVPGESYLVAAHEGTVAICGLSGPAEPHLRQLYLTAFAN